MINLTYWDMALGLIAIASLLINILQFFKSRQIQYHARGIYSQLWDIIIEIDRQGVKSVEELKRLINQVRIETIALNHTLGTKEKVIKPWDFGIEQSRARFRREIDWKQEKSSLKTQLQETKQKENDLLERLREAEEEVEKRK